MAQLCAGRYGKPLELSRDYEFGPRRFDVKLDALTINISLPRAEGTVIHTPVPCADSQQRREIIRGVSQIASAFSVPAGWKQVVTAQCKL